MRIGMYFIVNFLTSSSKAHLRTHYLSIDGMYVHVACFFPLPSHVSLKHVYTRFGVWCLWWFHYPGLLLRTELMVSLFIRCTMRCEIWAQPAELPR